MNQYTGFTTNCKVCGKSVEVESLGMVEGVASFRFHCDCPLPDGKPCIHPGCMAHQTHPCEVCGRIGGVNDKR